MELKHFNKPFVRNTRKKTPPGEIFELFLLDTLKTTLLNGWTQLDGPKDGHN